MCCSSGGQQEHPKFKVRHLHVQITCFYNAEEKRAKKNQRQLQLLHVLQTINFEMGAVLSLQANERTF